MRSAFERSGCVCSVRVDNEEEKEEENEEEEGAKEEKDEELYGVCEYDG